MVNLTNNATALSAKPNDIWQFSLLTHIQAAYYCIAFWYQLLILLVFFYNRTLLTIPFNVYLMDMLVSYALGTGLRFISDAGSIVSGTYSYRSVPWCPVRILSEWVVSPAAAQGHVLLALMRIWAVTAPMSYRVHHTKAAAILACVVINLVAYATRLPHFIVACQDSGKSTCAVNTKALPELFYTIKYVSPASSVVVFGTFPFVILMRWFQRNRVATTLVRTPRVNRKGEFSVFAGITLVSFILWLPIIVTSNFLPTWRLLNDSLRLWSLLTYVVDPTVFILLTPASRAVFSTTVKGIISGRHKVHRK